MQDYKKINYPTNKDVVLRYIPGHFVTPYSHVNYYMDLSDMKARQREARATGEELANLYIASDVIDRLQRGGLTAAVCGDLEKHAYSVNDRVKDGEIRNMHILCGV